MLLAKSGGDTAKQVYRFNKGDSDIAMRFDLTVPLARYVAQHYGELTFPFRRYHIGKVYRGEKPQKGRFREFYQCDIDIIGNGTLGIVNDAEIVSVISVSYTHLGRICGDTREASERSAGTPEFRKTKERKGNHERRSKGRLKVFP